MWVHSRGNAAAATEEYRKKKHVEVRQEDIERARRITKTLNEHETKATTRTHKTEVSVTLGAGHFSRT